ncbi:MAG: hypothetical protein IPF98_08275 [Gemmatimonadetes bacterium]|nr:hypothetical protein [Gemmatimonadota bacterium]MCC6771580.1 hypothetical protein [Gemmatimonadaceae bacterium]
MTRATSPWQHPVVQFIGWLLGCYFVLSLAQRLSPLHVVLTVLCGIFASTIYLLRFHSSWLLRLYAMRYVGGIIEWIAQVSGEPVPGGVAALSRSNGSASSAPGAAGVTASDSSAARSKSSEPPPSPFVPQSPADYALMLDLLKREVRGHQRALDRIVRSLRQTAELRARAADGGGNAPLGIHLLIGGRGIGKRFLAARLAAHLYTRGGGTVVDATSGGDVVAPLVEAVRADPAQVLVIEAADQLPAEAVSQLVAVASGAPLLDAASGARVSCRNTVILLLVHRSADALSDIGAVESIGTGQTQLLDRIVAELGVDRRLAWALNGAHPLVLPPPMVLAEIIAGLIDREAQRFGVRISRIHEATLAREVQVVRELSSLELTPSRVAKIVRDPAHRAITDGQQAISIGTIDNAPRENVPSRAPDQR